MEDKVRERYHGKHPDGVAGFVDDFQRHLSKIEGLAVIMEREGHTTEIPSYSDGTKKRMLLSHLAGHPEISHLLQHCRDTKNQTFEQCC